MRLIKIVVSLITLYNSSIDFMNNPSRKNVVLIWSSLSGPE